MEMEKEEEAGLVRVCGEACSDDEIGCDVTFITLKVGERSHMLHGAVLLVFACRK